MAKPKAASAEKAHAGFQVGSAYLVHTHLGIWLGVIVGITLDELTLDQCSWIPDQGRMGKCVRDGEYAECEFVGDGVVVPRNAIKVPWRHAMPNGDRPQ